MGVPYGPSEHLFGGAFSFRRKADMNLREARKALGWSRAELARRAEVDRSVLQLLELGQSADAESRQRCARALRAAGYVETDD